MVDYLITLALLTLAALIGRSYRLTVASVSIFANWCICTVLALYVFPNEPGDYTYPAAPFAAADYAAAFSVLVLVPLIFGRLPSFTHKVIAAIWGVQMVWHGYYLCSPRTTDLDVKSWYFLSDTAWLQLAVLAGDGICSILYRHHLFDRSARHFQALFKTQRGK